MGKGRMFSWAIVAVFVLVPFNWFRLWLQGEVPADATLLSLAAGTAFSWALGGALGFFLVVSARGIRARKAQEQRAIEALRQQPLVSVTPRQALLQPGEVAFAAVRASLQEVHTVGYETRTRGSSHDQILGTGTNHYSTGISKAVNEALTVATGELVVTNTRVIFAGDHKSFVLGLNTLVSISPYSDGFTLSNGHTTHTVLVQDSYQHAVFQITLQKVLNAAGGH